MRKLRTTGMRHGRSAWIGTWWKLQFNRLRERAIKWHERSCYRWLLLLLRLWLSSSQQHPLWCRSRFQTSPNSSVGACCCCCCARRRFSTVKGGRQLFHLTSMNTWILSKLEERDDTFIDQYWPMNANSFKNKPNLIIFRIFGLVTRTPPSVSAICSLSTVIVNRQWYGSLWRNGGTHRRWRRWRTGHILHLKLNVMTRVVV